MATCSQGRRGVRRESLSMTIQQFDLILVLHYRTDLSYDYGP